MKLFRSASPAAIDLALTLIRVVTGVIFIAHGGQKLFVYGLEGVSGGFAQMGVPAPQLMGPFIAFVEFLGGIALVLGLLTRLASAGLAATMVGAIFLVHIGAGFFNPNGVEFPLSLLASTIALVITGAGRYSADSLIAARRSTEGVPSVSGTIRRAA